MGTPLKSLLDKRDYAGFLPDYVASVYEWQCLYNSQHVVHHYGSEIIWQAVRESTWLQLQAYLSAMDRHRLWKGPASLVRLERKLVLGKGAQGLGTMARCDFDIHTILESTGVCTSPFAAPNVASSGDDSTQWVTEFTPFSLDAASNHTDMHLMCQDFIRLFNAKHPDLVPPLRPSADLAARLLPLGGLRTFQADRK